MKEFYAARDSIRKFFASKNIYELTVSKIGEYQYLYFHKSSLYFQKGSLFFDIRLIPLTNDQTGYWVEILIDHNGSQIAGIVYPGANDSPLTDPDLALFLDALSDPKLLPLCLGIDWAQVLVSHMLSKC
jgi:hypothetical protein